MEGDGLPIDPFARTDFFCVKSNIYGSFFKPYPQNLELCLKILGVI